MLTALARSVQVVGGRPRAEPPAGYRVVATTLVVPPLVTEIRYGSSELGATHSGDGLTFTGVTLGAGLEDAMYAQRATDPASVVDRRVSAPMAGSNGARAVGLPVSVPAVSSGLVGGNGDLVWEVGPGVVAYLGWSGALSSPEGIEGVMGLAGRGSNAFG